MRPWLNYPVSSKIFSRSDKIYYIAESKNIKTNYSTLQRETQYPCLSLYGGCLLEQLETSPTIIS